MKKYSSKRAKKGKLAYRTPSRFTPHQIYRITKAKSTSRNRKHPEQRFGAGFIYQKCQQITKSKGKQK